MTDKQISGADLFLALLKKEWEKSVAKSKLTEQAKKAEDQPVSKFRVNHFVVYTNTPTEVDGLRVFKIIRKLDNSQWETKRVQSIEAAVVYQFRDADLRFATDEEIRSAFLRDAVSVSTKTDDQSSEKLLRAVEELTSIVKAIPAHTVINVPTPAVMPPYNGYRPTWQVPTTTTSGDIPGTVSGVTMRSGGVVSYTRQDDRERYSGETEM